MTHFNRSNRRRLLKFLALSTFLASGCASGKTFVTQPTSEKLRVASINIEEDASTVTVSNESKETFLRALEEELYKEGLFSRGTDLKVKWHFVQFDKGSRAKRYLLGFGAGKGSLAVQAVFVDATGKDLATIQAEGEISMGAFGGSIDSALQKCAEQVATYAEKNFR